MLTNYETYKAVLGDLCKIPEDCYEMIKVQAIGEINRYTNVVFEKIPDSDKKIACFFYVMEAIYGELNRQGVASENTDGYSVTYTKAEVIYPIIRRSLGEYIYRGIEQ